MKKFYRRSFLNKRGYNEGAHIIAKIVIENRREKTGKTWKSIDGDLTISDCTRAARLDFWADDKKDLANSLYKLRLLRKTINEFADAYEEAAKELDL